MAYGGLSFPGTDFPVPDAGYIYLVWKYQSIGYSFYIYPSAY